MKTKMTKDEITKKLIEHYARSIGCNECFVGCGYKNFLSIKQCEKRVKLAYVEAEK